eukprot:scaffold50435_cov27-Phaeocystis_antarctica.AAC.1
MVRRTPRSARHTLRIQAALRARSCIHLQQGHRSRLLCRAREGTPRGQEQGLDQEAQHRLCRHRSSRSRYRRRTEAILEHRHRPFRQLHPRRRQAMARLKNPTIAWRYGDG